MTDEWLDFDGYHPINRVYCLAIPRDDQWEVMPPRCQKVWGHAGKHGTNDQQYQPTWICEWEDGGDVIDL